jgi:hypothetical protein
LLDQAVCGGDENQGVGDCRWSEEEEEAAGDRSRCSADYTGLSRSSDGIPAMVADRVDLWLGLHGALWFPSFRLKRDVQERVWRLNVMQLAVAPQG